MQRDEHRAAEALELQRPRDLGMEARLQARGREHGEGEEDRRLDEHEACGPRSCCARAARTPDVYDDERREHRGPELRRDRRAERERSEREPLVQERGEREHRERCRPEVEAG